MDPFSIFALVGVGLSIGGMFLEADTNKQVAKMQAQTAKEEREFLAETNKKAQELLQKTTDQVVTDLDASKLLTDGLLTQNEFDGLELLNQQEEGALAYLDNLYTEGQAEDEEAFTQALDGLVNSGKITIEELTAITNSLEDVKDDAGNYFENVFSKENRLDENGDPRPDNIYNIIEENYDISKSDIESAYENSMGFIKQSTDIALKELEDAGLISKEEITKAKDEGVGLFAPWVEAGKTALLARNVLMGVASPEEVQLYSELSGIDASPLLEMQKNKARDALLKQQRARGMSLSPKAIEEMLTNIDLQYDAQYSERVFNELGKTSESGRLAATDSADLQLDAAYKISDIITGTSRDKAVLEERKGESQVDAVTRRADALDTLNATKMDFEFAVGEQLGTTMGALITEFGLLKAEGMAKIVLERRRQVENANALQTDFDKSSEERRDKYGDLGYAIIGGADAAERGLIDRTTTNRVNLATNYTKMRANARLGHATQSTNLGYQYAVPQVNLGLQKGAFDAAAKTSDQKALGSMFQQIGDIGAFFGSSGSTRKALGPAGTTSGSTTLAQSAKDFGYGAKERV